MRKSFSLALIVAMLLAATGCFTNAVDKCYMGYSTPDARPAVQNREFLGHALVPFTFVLDVATSPIQGWMLMAGGDEAVYGLACKREHTQDEVPPPPPY